MRGLIIGKFYPFHKGHCFLVDVALNLCDEVCVFLCSKTDEYIKGEQRLKWIEHEYPQLMLYHITKEISDAHASNPEAPHIWSKEIWQLLDNKQVDYVFASEEYGKALAENLHATFLMVDIQRSIVPISGSAIREHIYQHWDFLADSVKPDFVKIITVDGKENLLCAFAEHVGGMYIQVNDVLTDVDVDVQKICAAKINALKKQDYPLIIYKLSNEKRVKIQEEYIIQESAAHFSINSEEDIVNAVGWWLGIVEN